jgi:predicted dehydrogenase
MRGIEGAGGPVRTARGRQSKRFVRARLVDERPLNVAVVGYGYWGPNLVRNVSSAPDLELAALCERDPGRGELFSRRNPDVPVEADFDELLLDPSLDAVIVATPPSTHHLLCKRALQAGKHVLVEKPMAKTSAQARELKEIAERHGLVLMPGHTFLYSPAVNKVRELINNDAVGEVYFVTSSRMNLGNYQPDGVVCDLAPHDLSIILHWLERPVVQVAAFARNIFQEHVAETAFITLTFAGGTTANVQVSWLAPRKMRQMLIVGSRRMISYDDTLSDEPVRVYDRGMEFSTPESFGEYQLTYRSGDVVIPRVEPAEPLALELQDFARAILTGSTPVSHAQLGLDVVTAMEAIELSLLRNGEPVTLNAEPDAAVA